MDRREPVEVATASETDAMNARTLARFAEWVRPTPRPLPSEAIQLFEAQLTRRRQGRRSSQPSSCPVGFTITAAASAAGKLSPIN